MYKRFVVKIVGASGQGVNVLGGILSRAFKRSGFGIFGYREYPSLIKGGHATFQIDISETYINSSSEKTDVLIVLNKQSTKWHLEEMRENSIIIHDIDNPRIFKTEAEIIKSKNIKLVYFPALDLVGGIGGNELHGNIATIGALWNALGLSLEVLTESIKTEFKDKPQVIEKNLQCLELGFKYSSYDIPAFKAKITRWNAEDLVSNDEKSILHFNGSDLSELVTFNLQPKSEFEKSLIINGNLALSLGAINSGVRIYYSYPMTPASSILTYLAEMADETGMIVKQVEDEITASAMAIGSNFMGTRSLTGTSGGGFDLMTEHLSLAGMIEVPFVVVLGQRPGPATGMPTWTAQGDLMLSIFSGHGEFPRVVLAPATIEDCFYSIQEAFNIAEKYQIPVIVLTDKFLAESTTSVNEFDKNRIPIVRNLVDEKDLEKLESKDRYRITENGVSLRWLPGQKAADFNSNSDEHTEEGNVTEDAEESERMIEKRIKKLQTIHDELPVDQIVSNNSENPAMEINILSWGSTGSVVRDTFELFKESNIKVNLLNLTYLWPLNRSVLQQFVNQQNVVLIEGNNSGQLGHLVRMTTGVDTPFKVLKWNGRPFTPEEILSKLSPKN